MAIFEKKDQAQENSAAPAGSITNIVPGMSDWQKYNYVEVDGKRYSFDQLDKKIEGTDIKLRQAITPTAKDIYRTPDGGMTQDLAKTVGVSLNKDTGKITITAPKEYSKNESFKNIFNEDYLKQLSSAYKRNPDYKIPDPLDDSDERKDISIPELVEKFDDTIKEYGRAQDTISKNRAIVAASDDRNTGIAQRLTEQDFITMGASPWQDDASGSSLLAIPKAFDSVFRNVEGYNADTGYISKDDFMNNFWNLEKQQTFNAFNINSYPGIEAAQKAVEKYFNESDFQDTDEYARMTAFSDFITHKTPGSDPLRWAALQMESLTEGVAFGVGKFAVGTLSLAEGLRNLFVRGGDRDDSTFSTDAEREAFHKDDWTLFGDMYKGLDEWSADEGERLGNLTSTGLAVFSLAKLGGEIGPAIAAAIATGGAASARVGAAVGMASESLSGAEAAAGAMSIGEQLIAGSAIELSALSTEEAVSLARSAASVVSMANRGAAITKGAVTVSSTAAGLVAESIVDAATTDPVVFRGAIEGELNDETGAYFLEQAAWNVGGWGVGVAGKKVAKEFATTAAGKFLNARGAKAINKMSLAATSLDNKAHALFLGDDWVEKISNKGKKQAREFNKFINEARRGVTKSKTTEEILQNVNYLKRAQNAVDMLQRAGSTAVAEYTSKRLHATLNGIAKELGDTGTNIMKLEKQLGLYTKASRKITENSTPRVFSVATANYISARAQLDLLDSIEKVSGGLTQHQKNGRKVLQQMVDNSTAEMGMELVAEADKYLEANKRWWAEFNSIRADQGLLNKAEVDELKASGLWGENGELYMRTQRVQGDPTYIMTRADNSSARKNITELDKYNWGSEKDFADPMVVRYEAMVQAGVEKDSKAFIEAAKQIPTIDIKTIRSASETEAVRVYKKNIDNFTSTISASVADSFSESIAKSKLLGNLVDKKEFQKLAEEFGDTAIGQSAERMTIVSDKSISGVYNDTIDSFKNTILSDKSNKGLLDKIAEVAGEDIDDITEYVIMRQLEINHNAVRKAVKKEMASQIEEIAAEKGWNKYQKQAYAKQASDGIMKTVADRFDNVRTKLLEKGGKAAEMVDKKEMFTQMQKLARDIEGDKALPGRIAYQNSDGAVEILDIPTYIADLYEFRPNETLGTVAKAFNTSAKIFRLGTTGVNITSLVNQQIRDYGNAWLAGGMWHTFSGAADRLEREFGSSVVEQIKKYDSEAYKSIVAISEETGESLEQAAVRQVQARAEVYSPSATETAAYRRVSEGKRQIYSIKNNGKLVTTIDNKIDNVADVLGKPNELREQYLRKSVYVNGFYEAMKRGETYHQALESARFIMNNATTNFSRQMVHLRRFQKTVPYLGAAINGTKSFYRLLSVDPVGVMSRLIGGAIIPTVALTAHNMSNKENRDKYEQFAEYEKENNLIIGVGGQFVKIPMPQEISPILSPFRQFVEYTYGDNKHSFWELAAHDLLGVCPVDIDGFYDLDQSDLMHDPTFWDRMSNGVSGLVSQILPPPVKSVVMATTGRDPFTGKKIDTRYSYYDPETGTVEIMDSSQSAFAKMISGLFGGSAQMAEAVTSNLIGQTGLDLLDILVSAGQAAATGGEEGSFTTAAERAITRATKPLTVADYDRTASEWNQAIRQSYERKNAIINDPQGQYQKLTQQISMAKDSESRNKLLAQRKSLLQPWQDEVKHMIETFSSKYGSDKIDRFRMASLISLLNVQNTNVTGYNSYNLDISQETYYSGRNEAIRTLIDMGCNATGDTSMLGYVYRNPNTGEIATKYNTPLEILAAQNAWYEAKDIHKANIEQLVEAADLRTKKKEIKAQRDALYDAAKPDYDQINALEVNWNAEVMKTIAPYVERMGAESAINNEDVMEYLEDLIYVPSEFKKDKYGKYVTNKKLSRNPTDTSTGADADATKAYIENYIKQIWKVNDTSWYNGKNYSGRKTLGV